MIWKPLTIDLRTLQFALSIGFITSVQVNKSFSANNIWGLGVGNWKLRLWLHRMKLICLSILFPCMNETGEINVDTCFFYRDGHDLRQSCSSGLTASSTDVLTQLHCSSLFVVQDTWLEWGRSWNCIYYYYYQVSINKKRAWSLPNWRLPVSNRQG